MFNKVFIIDEDISGSVDLAAYNPDANKSFCYILDLAKREEVLSFITSCFDGDPIVPFSIGIKNLSSEFAQNLNDIAVLLAHPLCIRAEGCVEVSYVDNVSDLVGTDVLHCFLQGQGYSKIRINRISGHSAEADFTAMHLSGNTERIIRSEQEFIVYYHQYLSTAYNYDDRFFIRHKGQVSREAKINWMQSVERSFIKANPYLATLVQETYKSKQKCNSLEEVAESRLNELQTVNKLFAISSEANEVEHILQFYHREYESLPLWYKRFGHVIKVLTGKRDWRSVFNGKGK